jgi:hypothetical protein
VGLGATNYQASNAGGPADLPQPGSREVESVATEALVTEIPEEKKELAPVPHGDMY